MQPAETGFFALLYRLKYINRWGLMRNAESENLKEHTVDVAFLAHALAVIRKQQFGDGRVCPSPEKVAVYALFHDVTEIITGDLPTPIKYDNQQLRYEYALVEQQAATRLLSFLPSELQDHYSPFFAQATTAEERAIHELVKAADVLSAYIKCLAEANAGNQDFLDAEQTIKTKLDSYDLPELNYFMQVALPSFGKTLDQLSKA